MTERTLDTPRTFIGAIGEIVDYGIDFVVVEVVREETAQERAMRKWGMKEEPWNGHRKA